MADTHDELRKLAEQKRMSAKTLKDTIAKSLSASERIFFLLKENLSEDRQKMEEESDGSMSSTVSEVEGILDTIVSSSENGSLADIKSQSKRLRALKNVLNDLNKSLTATESKRIGQQVAQTEKGLNDAMKIKSSLSSRAKGFLGAYGIDVTSLAVGAAGKDPIGAFLARAAGGVVERGLESRKERKQQLLSDKKALYENTKQSQLSIPRSEPMGGNQSFESPLAGATGEGQANTKLEEIKENTKEMKVDIKTLVQYEEEKMAKEEKQSFNDIENTAEAGRNKSGLFGKIAEKTKDILDKPKSFIRSAMGNILELGREVIGGLIGGLIGAGTLTAIMTSISTAFAAAVPILIPVILASLAGYAWYKALQALPKAWDALMFDLKGIGKSMLELPNDLKYEFRKLAGKLTPEEEKKERQTDIVKGGEKAREAKQKLQEAENATGFFAPNKNNPVVKAQMELQREGIKNAQRNILKEIIAEHPNASAENITNLYNRAVTVPGEKPASPSDLGLIGGNIRKDYQAYDAKVGQLRQRMSARGASEEEIQSAISKVSAPGDKGFKVPPTIAKSYGITSQDISQAQKVPEKSAKVSDAETAQLQSKEMGAGTGVSASTNLPINFDAYANRLGKRESGNDYGNVNSIGFLGRYQFGAAALEDAGLLKPGASKKGSNKTVLSNPDNWTIAGGQEGFLKNSSLQDKVFADYTQKHYAELQKQGVITADTPSEDVSGYLMGAHLKGVGGVKDYVLGGKDNADAYGTDVSSYIKMGQQNEKMAKSSIVSPQVSPASTALANLAAKNTELVAGNKGGETTIFNNMSNIPRNTSQPPNTQAGANGPVHTRPMEPTLIALSEKQMKGSVT